MSIDKIPIPSEGKPDPVIDMMPDPGPAAWICLGWGAILLVIMAITFYKAVVEILRILG